MSIILHRAVRESSRQVQDYKSTNSPEAHWPWCLYNTSLGQCCWGQMRAMRKVPRWSWVTSGWLQRAQKLSICSTSSREPLKSFRWRSDVIVPDEFKTCQYLEEQEGELLRWNPHSPFLKAGITEGEGEREGDGEGIYYQFNPIFLLLTSSPNPSLPWAFLKVCVEFDSAEYFRAFFQTRL